jgi:hypothetical protein
VSGLIRAVAVTLLMAGAFSANAQLASDPVPRERIVPRSEEVRRALENSRFRLGPIRLRPLFELRDAGYDNNVFGTSEDPVADWHSTVSAGADLILPFGRKMYLTGIVNPEYTWYQKLTNRRMLGGEYGAAILALFNRLSIEAGGTTRKTLQPVSSELERSVPGRRDNTYARTELEIFRRVSLFASAEARKQRYEALAADDQGVGLDRLERNETFLRGGVRYRLRSWLDVTAGVEKGTTNFVSAVQSDNSTRAAVVGVHYDRPRFFLNLSGGSSNSDASGPNSTFPNYSTAVGSYYAAYQTSRPLAVDGYGHREPVYGLYGDSAYFLETRNGLGLIFQLGKRIGLRAFSELGTNAYPIGSAAPSRTDRVTIIGGGLAYRVFRNLILTTIASETRYRSNIDTFSRSILRVATTISVRGDSSR